MKAFVYGTLKNGFLAHDLLKDSTFLGPATTHPRYRLYDLGRFPGIIVDGSLGTGVIGELYEVPENLLPELDRYEAVAFGLFRREEIELSDGTIALAYLYNRRYDGCQIVESGEWTHGAAD